MPDLCGIAHERTTNLRTNLRPRSASMHHRFEVGGALYRQSGPGSNTGERHAPSSGATDRLPCWITSISRGCKIVASKIFPHPLCVAGASCASRRPRAVIDSWLGQGGLTKVDCLHSNRTNKHGQTYLWIPHLIFIARASAISEVVRERRGKPKRRKKCLGTLGCARPSHEFFIHSLPCRASKLALRSQIKHGMMLVIL
jgi:hypothetical protein